ncbi:histidine ammonia-lyase [Rhizobium sp. KVB221]|uniref:Histidine ammonia-lyase n=1 Tax=Rhizobium setariae TaxID=2801340 RepID=A0A937CR65_9HYPH|nr:histidine ammonia-lyase [Rhizobium setariae]MBL0375444.1 histidine ammonia-lyase [Rhizobium setariae]
MTSHPVSLVVPPIISLGATPPKIEEIAAIARRHHSVVITSEADKRVNAARAVVERHLALNLPVYGLNTGLGAGVDTRLSEDDLIEFQLRVPHGHAVGVGPALAQDEVRAIMAVRIACMSRGGTGVSSGVFHGLVAALNAGVHPVIPSWGSIGAADLAPLAHMGMALLGHGEVEYGGEILPASVALERTGLKPLNIRAKDGHALVGANSLSVGQACLKIEDIEQVFDWSLKAISLNFEAFRANLTVLDDRVLAARPAFGQRVVGAQLRSLLAGSALFDDGAARRIQDPLSYRCVPQVLGALRHAIDEVRAATEIELASSGDNPVVLPAEGEILSNGNFDIVAFVLSWERLGQAIAHCATGTAYRLMKLMSPATSELPRFLVPEGQNRSGFAVLQKAIAAMEADIRHLANPISLAPIAVSDSIEDQASMAPRVVEKTGSIIERFRYLVAIELLVSAHALELRGMPEKLGIGAEASYKAVRDRVGSLDDLSVLSGDITQIVAMISKYDISMQPKVNAV